MEKGNKGIGNTLTKMLEALVCGVICGCIVSMTPSTLVVLMMLIPGGDRFYEPVITFACPLVTFLSVAFFCYLDFIRKPSHSGTEDDSPRSYKWSGFAGEILGSLFPIIVWL